jgi:lysophospholipase
VLLCVQALHNLLNYKREGKDTMGLVSIADNPVPEGATTGMLKTRDGVSLRYARWGSEVRAKGTVCLLQGRTEFIEKYFEVVRELRSRGFAVVTFDWRGQGLSERALPERQKGHVEDFRQYDIDLETVIEQVVLPNNSPPLIGLAHSMGAAIILRSAAGKDRHFDRMVLTSPMIGLPYIGSSALVRAAFHAMRRCGFGTSYVPGGGSTIVRPFAGNKHTSDPERYARTAAILAAEPALGIGSPTIAWTGAALDAMGEFAEADYPARIRNPTLIVAAGGDEIASTAASRTFASRAGAVSDIVIEGARHELLIEQSGYRAQFWSAFDSFAV